MNIYKFRSIAVVIGLVFMSGCIGYVSPYPEYSAPMAAPYVAPPVPYGGYSYRVYPAVPFFGFGGRPWRHGGYRHYRHH